MYMAVVVHVVTVRFVNAENEAEVVELQLDSKSMLAEVIETLKEKLQLPAATKMFLKAGEKMLRFPADLKLEEGAVF